MKFSDLKKITDTKLETPSGKMLVAIQSTMSHVYGGTVPPETVARRRKANKAARKARQVHRSHR